MSKPLKILFVHNGQEKFVCDDLRLLRESHAVTDWYQSGRAFNPTRLYALLARQDLIFCWFASWHSLAPVLLARLLRKPAVVVVGGYDTANVPEANYGAQRGGLRRLVARVIIRRATWLITNSYSARNEAVVNAGADPDKIEVIYHGVEPALVNLSAPRQRTALTVGGVLRENFLRKGLLPFVQAAAYVPEVQFTLVGGWFDDSINDLKCQASPNVTFAGQLSKVDLQAAFAYASVYVQASLHEGFGLSLAEAMAAGCIPVVTRVGALPEVVGSHGIFLASNTPQDVAEGIRQGLDSGLLSRQPVRDWIIEQFPMQRRRELLNRLIATLL